jgi:methionine sulfoxide reductase heme-binding subunit
MKIFTAKRFHRLVFWLSFAPLGYLIVLTLRDDLGANPVQRLIQFSGTWSLNFLLATLAMSPLVKMTGNKIWFGFLKLFGLWMFFFALLHALVYVGIDHAFDWEEIFHDVFSHVYLISGLIALLLSVPLAATSNQWLKNKLGVFWKKLHQLIYVIAVLAVLHYWLAVKLDISSPFLYCAILMLLLIFRLLP